ncbi:hypothetical protein GSI_05482 [Ganoderma sinense ZZ0214-1]|uniref:Uncharacterized protein n=1 Tax=Ganoderma sinense ZZ0214-1 TaxID=1077348 RepID=A0A2G8SEW5_9APHY|nr:hypothetical protein GSI_05482 [Ganoderma sinense ZZ0214-1]
MASTQRTCPLKCDNDRPTYHAVHMQFEESEEEPDAAGTLDRRLVALGHSAEKHDAAQIKLAREAQVVAAKVKVQTRRLVAHHDKIARLYAETTMLQEEAQEVTNACQEQAHAIQELRRQVYEAECNVFHRNLTCTHTVGGKVTSLEDSSTTNVVVPARRSRSAERGLDPSVPQTRQNDHAKM